MAEGGGSGGGGTSEPKPVAVCEDVGGRLRFTVELIPGQTTIVSWKKLQKDAANKNALPSSKPDRKAITGPGPAQSSGLPEQSLPLVAHPSLNARLAPGQVPEDEAAKDGPPTSRLSTVIEKIERLYVGKASSDEEDLNDVVRDDDEYDTEDSFIDDAELDEYFQVDNSAIKHDGFFVNRGKLERVGEPTAVPNQQPKKRRRKDLAKDDGGDVGLPNKHLKVGKKDGKSVQVNGKNSVNPEGVAVPSVHPENVKLQNQINASKSSLKKKSADSRSKLEAPPSGGSDGFPMLEEKDTDQQKAVLLSKDHRNKLKEGRELAGSSNERVKDKSSSAQGKSSSGRSFNNVDELSESIQQREKGGLQATPETSVPEGNNSLQVAKVPSIRRKEGSSGRAKSTMLDKAIRDLEKLVSESRPPSVEGQDSDNNAFQAVKRRLRPEIKQKLAKVARLAQASHGKITKELLNRLMSIVGHMIQIRSLKRNLETMVSMGLSAKQEKDTRVQQIKEEIAEMVKARIPLMNSKALEQLAGTSDDFQESNTEEKEAFRRKHSMDDALEDKICYLYDLYIEGLEEDAGPQVRKLYAELAALWPNGFMDNHGIKRAICRAKDRRRALQSRNKDQEKIKKKKVVTPNTVENVQVEANSLAQPQYTQDKLVSDADHVLTSGNKSISTTTAASPSVRMPVSFMNGPSSDGRLKQEKVKGGSGSSSDTKGKNALPTKKIKRKTDTELMGTTQGEERQKSQKQIVVPQKPNLQIAAPSFQQLG